MWFGAVLHQDVNAYDIMDLTRVAQNCNIDFKMMSVYVRSV